MFRLSLLKKISSVNNRKLSSEIAQIKTPIEDSILTNPTFSKLVYDYYSSSSNPKSPLGRWCHPLSHNKCIPELKAKQANQDNSLCIISRDSKTVKNQYNSLEDELLIEIFNKTD